MKTVQYGVMWLLLCPAILNGAIATADTFGAAGNQFTIDFVTIANPGNPPKLVDSRPTGSVPYVFRMGKHEISRAMVNVATSAGHLGIDLDPMGYVPSGPTPDMPATRVSWNEAARFANWMNTSHGFSPAYKFATQPGQGGYVANANILLWNSSDSGYDASNPFRNSAARYFLPSEDEWFKAAYYDPKANGGNGRYWNYATGSNSAPRPVASGTTPGTAVCGQSTEQGPADVTQAGGLSPYGVMGMGGNVFEWQETEFDLINDTATAKRGLRGGSYTYTDYLTSAFRINDVPDYQTGDFLGFRVASAVEPSVTADYDYDGDTDGADFLVWQRSFGSQVDLGADGDHSGIIDAGDLAVWSAHFGDVAASNELTSAVPEPRGALLLVMGILFFPLLRRFSVSLLPPSKFSCIVYPSERCSPQVLVQIVTDVLGR